MTGAHAGTAWLDFKGDFTGLNREVNAAVAPLARQFSGRFGKAMGPVMAKQSEHLRTFTTAAKYATVGAAGFAAYGLKHVVRTGAEFESQMARVQAVSSATGTQMGGLNRLALKLGADTKFSAGEAASGMYELSSAGFKVGEMKKAIGGTLSLAAASSIDLASAAEISSNALKGFGLEASESVHVADVLAKSVNTSSVEMQDLQLTLKYIGPIAKATGQSFESMIAAAGVMGDAGIKGEQSGTTLRAGLLRLVKPTKQVKEGLGELSVSANEIYGPKGLVPLPRLVAELEEGMGGLSKAQQNQALTAVFGQEAMSGMYELVDAGPAKLRRLAKEFVNADGAAGKAAHTMNDTVMGAWDELTGSTETLEIKLFQEFDEPLQDALNDATEFVNEIGAIMTDDRLDFGQRLVKSAELAEGELGRLWEQADVPEHFAKAISAAVPIVAEQAGELGLEAAKGFTRGFFTADPVGKAVMAAWLLNFLGGKAAFAGTGRFFGVTLGNEIAAGAAAGAASGGVRGAAGRSIVEGVVGGAAGGRWLGTERSQAAFMRAQNFTMPTSEKAALAAQGGIFGGVMGGAAGKSAGSKMAGGLLTKLRSVKWGRIGGLGLGLALADGVLGEFERRAKAHSDDLQEALLGRSESMLGKGSFLGDKDLFGIQVFQSDEGAAAGNLLAQYQELLGTRVKLSQATIESLRAQAQEVDLSKEQREQIDRMFATISAARQLGVRRFDLGMDPAKLRKIRSDFNFLKGGVGTSMADINRVTKRANRNIVANFGEGTKEARQLTARNMRLTASAIEQQMQRSGKETKQGMARVEALIRGANLVSPTRKQARDFGREWAACMDRTKEATRSGVNEMIREAKRMPAPMRKVALDAWFEQARQAKQSGKLSVDAFRSMRSRVLSEFSGVKLGSQKLSGGVVSNVQQMVNESSSALGVLMSNVDSVLGALDADHKAKWVIQVASGGAEQRRQGGGFIVPGTGSGDTFKTVLPVGSFVENREAVRRLPFQGGGVVPVALEPGERVHPPEQVRRIGADVLRARNDAVPRHGFQKGGPVGQLPAPTLEGPAGALREIGRGALALVVEEARKYLREQAPSVGGGDIVAVGHNLQRLGYEVGEHPAFGGVAPVHVQGSAHYTADAIDVNDDAAPYGHGSSEMESLDWLAAQLKRIPHEQIIWRDHDLDTGAPIPDHMGHLHFQMQLGGLIQKLIKGGFVSTAYGPPWDAMNGTGVTATGVDLTNAPKKHIVAVDPDVIPLGSQLSIQPNPFHTQEAFGAEDTGGAIQGNRIDFYDWRGRDSQMAWGRRTVNVEDFKGGAQSDEHSFKEDVPATYRGCRTGSLDFPGMPKSLKAVEQEIGKRDREIGRYRRAVAAAEKENRPSLAQALQKNVTALEARLAQLRTERHKQRVEKAKRKFSKRLNSRLGKVAGYETEIAGMQRAFDMSSQGAEQIVALEPQMPDLPQSATNAQRQAAEKDYVARFTEYVNTKERPVYTATLDKAADWRNTILRAESFGFGEKKPSVARMQVGWEKEIREVVAEIERINEFSDKVAERLADWRRDNPKTKDLPKWLEDQIKDRDRLQEKLPTLRFQDRELRKVLGEGRQAFYPGGKNRISPPNPPLEGSGTLEDALASVQGIHWPGLHELLPAAALAPPRVPGRFGGSIWDVQTSIEELGLKITQAASSIDGSSSDEEDERKSEQRRIEDELNLDLRKKLLISETQRNTILGWDEMLASLPRFHTGGEVHAPPSQEVPIMVRGGEWVLTEDQKAALSGGRAVVLDIDEIHIHTDGKLSIRQSNGETTEATVKRVVHDEPAIGRTTPGGARF